MPIIVRLHIRMQNISSDFQSENYLYNETVAAKSIGQNYHELPRMRFLPILISYRYDYRLRHNLNLRVGPTSKGNKNNRRNYMTEFRMSDIRGNGGGRATHVSMREGLGSSSSNDICASIIANH